MRPTRSDRRKSGISLAGDLPWGSHFGQFYQTTEDLLDVLVPYFTAGLNGNELCRWEVSEPLDVKTAREAMRQAVQGFSGLAKSGQMEIVSAPPKNAGKDADRRLIATLDKAVSRGFDGVRLAHHVPPAGAPLTDEIAAIRRHNVIAAFLYPRESFDAVGLMEVVKNHRFALVRNAGRWEILESTEARTAEDLLERTQEKLDYLFSSMSEGFAYHRIVLDAKGKPCDYVFLEVNEAFEKLTGLKAEDIVGRNVTQVLPGIEKDPTDWIGRYGRVALTRQPDWFESHSESLGRWFAVSAFSPQKGYFAATFTDVTDRRLSEQKIARQAAVLAGINRIFREAMSCDSEGQLGQLCLSVAEEVTGSTFGFVDELNAGGRLDCIALSDPAWDASRNVTALPRGLAVRGLRGRAVADAEAFSTNEPPSRPDTIGLPPGHPPLSAFMAAPLLQNGRAIGVVAVANKPGGYGDEDRAALEALAEPMVQVLMRHRAEAARHAIEERLRVTLRSIGDAVIATDTDGRVVLLNRVAEELTGWTQAEASGRVLGDVFRIINEDTGGAAEDPVRKVIDKGTVVGLANHTLLVSKDGRRFAIADSAAPVRGDDGGLLGVVLVFRDVTAERRAEQALRESQERFKAIAANTPDHILIQDRDLRYTLVINPQLGLTEQGMLGKTDQEILAPEDAEKLGAVKNKVLETRQPVRVETSLKGPDGEQFFDGSYVPRLDGNGHVDGIIGYFRNVTDRKRAEIELDRLATQRQLALNAARLGWWHYDPQTGIARYDKRYTEIFGVSGSERANDEILKLLHPEDLPRVWAAVEAALDPVDPKPYETEYRVNRPDGEMRWVEAHGIAAFEGQGRDRRATSLVGTVQDITERKRSDDALRLARDDLDRKVKERTADLEAANRTLRMISACNEVLVRVGDEMELVRQTCQIVHELGGYRMAWVGYAEEDEGKSVRPVASVGFEDGYLETAQITWADEERGHGPTGACIRTGVVITCDDFMTDPALLPWRDQALKRGYRSSSAFPLRLGSRVFGALTIYAATSGAFGAGQVSLLSELADDLSLGIMSLRAQAERDHARQDAERRAMQLRALATQLGQAEQRERQRLAKMLHDHLQQLLVAAKFLVDALAGSSNPEQGRQRVTDVLDEAIQAARSLTAELVPPILHEKGLALGLAWLARHMREKYGLEVDVKAGAEAAPLPQQVLAFAFEAVRELLFNVVKHAQVKAARVTCEGTATHVVITVEDGGVGFDGDRTSEAGSGFGLFSIKERADYFGGNLSVESSPGNGSRFTLRVPIRQSPDAEPRAATGRAEQPLGAAGLEPRDASPGSPRSE